MLESSEYSFSAACSCCVMFSYLQEWSCKSIDTRLENPLSSSNVTSILSTFVIFRPSSIISPSVFCVNIPPGHAP
ncbi:hypothetical protein H5410_001928 [Solanum commersonii]|uniref:Uncharacterized protein n=1 Tax=Solanum commersonii TaxID=4109 RepID=A0A9J6B0Z0_SOLCO|nr:hypothetical protein H5410_001928 [Solanum commersonii]